MRQRRAAPALLLLVCAVVLSLPAQTALSATPPPPQVYAFPTPGSHVASPKSQIVFRGVPISSIGAITVVGSKSGAHTGTFRGDSDGRGASFLPTTAFSAGETVTVTTSLNIRGASHGDFHFTVANPAGGVQYKRAGPAPRVSGDVTGYRSRPDLRPVAIRVTKHARLPGDIFLTPWYGPVSDGPMITDANGGLIWYDPVPAGQRASDFRVQRYLGQPVLTWWEGMSGSGLGRGKDVIFNTAYKQIAVINGANGFPADLHEFQITSLNTALITTFQPVYWDTSSVKGGNKRQIVLDSVVQEIDIPTGLLLYQWDSLDHIPVSDSYVKPPMNVKNPYDYFHLNSIDVDTDGNLVVSGRHTWGIYKISRHTGAIIWRLGGKHSSFKLASGTYWAFQHDVRVQAHNDQYITLFDNESGFYRVRKQSAAVKLRLDLKHMTATHVQRVTHSPETLSPFAGDVQQLPDHNNFVGWGARPYMSEYSPSGKLLFDAHFVDENASYRTYLMPWSGQPDPTVTPPRIAVSSTRKGVDVYASWNGATDVSYWRVLAGTSPTALQSVSTPRRTAFETKISIGKYQYVAVQALDASKHLLGQSATATVR